MFINLARTFALAAAAVMCVAVDPNGGSVAATLKTLYSFCPQEPCPDGSLPMASLIMDPEGNLYGTTQTGGISNYCGQGAGCGTVFKLIPNAEHTKWTEKVLYSFCNQAGCADGADPIAGLVRDKKSGSLFGAAPGGYGVVFELTPPSAGDTIWTETVLYSFCRQVGCADGKVPLGGVILDKGNLYGMTELGGNGNGVVFELKPNAGGTGWSETVRYNFCAQTGCSDGSSPRDGLSEDGAGNLYGTTLYGGSSNTGVAFELTPGAGTLWPETVLYDFCSNGCVDGSNPVAGLVLDTSGNLYGSASGGEHGQGAGMAFQLSPRGGSPLDREDRA
jgi:uncharacterized repeat protein (TIGR03803 family)